MITYLFDKKLEAIVNQNGNVKDTETIETILKTNSFKKLKRAKIKNKGLLIILGKTDMGIIFITCVANKDGVDQELYVEYFPLSYENDAIKLFYLTKIGLSNISVSK